METRINNWKIENPLKRTFMVVLSGHGFTSSSEFTFLDLKSNHFWNIPLDSLFSVFLVRVIHFIYSSVFYVTTLWYFEISITYFSCSLGVETLKIHRWVLPMNDRFSWKILITRTLIWNYQTSNQNNSKETVDKRGCKTIRRLCMSRFTRCAPGVLMKPFSLISCCLSWVTFRFFRQNLNSSSVCYSTAVYRLSKLILWHAKLEQMNDDWWEVTHLCLKLHCAGRYCFDKPAMQ